MIGTRETIVCVGRLYVDLVMTGLPDLPRPGREIYASRLDLSPGGGAFITASYLAALGRPAALCASLGDDALSASLRPMIEASGLDLSSLGRHKAAEPQLTVALGHAGERAFVTRRVGPAAPASVRERIAKADVRHLHIAELATLVECPWLVPSARAKGLTVSLDIAWDDMLLAAPDRLDWLAGVDIVMPNEDEALALSGASDLEAALGVLRDRAPLVVVKRGAAGAIAVNGEHRIEVPAEPVALVDATGAGDAFCAGFLHAQLSGEPLAAALRLGAACGAVAVGRTGGVAPRMLAPDPP